MGPKTGGVLPPATLQPPSGGARNRRHPTNPARSWKGLPHPQGFPRTLRGGEINWTGNRWCFTTGYPPAPLRGCPEPLQPRHPARSPKATPRIVCFRCIITSHGCHYRPHSFARWPVRATDPPPGAVQEIGTKLCDLEHPAMDQQPHFDQGRMAGMTECRNRG